jgi:ABC-type transporter Mla MlaB component
MPRHLTGKRSIVSNSRTNERAVVSISGPLNYLALLELEVELGKLVGEASEIVLDLHGLTRADEEAVSRLCDAISIAEAHERVRVRLPPEPTARMLSTALKNEGVRLHQFAGVDIQAVRACHQPSRQAPGLPADAAGQR